MATIALSPRSRASCARAVADQSVSRGVAMTLSLSVQRRVSSCWSRSASSSRPIQRNFRMRLTRSFALLSSSAASSCFGRSSGIGMAILPHRSVVWRCRPRTAAFLASQSVAAERSCTACGRASRRLRQSVSFDLLTCLRKGAGVRRNIMRRKIDYPLAISNVAVGCGALCRVLRNVAAMKASMSRMTGTRKRRNGATAAMMMKWPTL